MALWGDRKWTRRAVLLAGAAGLAGGSAGQRLAGADQSPLVIHLHGAPNDPANDGFPTAVIRPGESIDYLFGNDLEAATLWYHDHSMGITRLNIYAGLAAPYWVRDEFDTGEDDNPLGLPAGEYELPLFISDKVFTRDGRMRYNSFRTTVLNDHWSGGLAGDVMVVNGKVWPRMMVDRGVYRIRLTSASQVNDYRIAFSNNMPFWVIGGDGGLLDRPVAVLALDVVSAERYDLLVDFTGFQPGDAVELLNISQISWLGQLGGSARVGYIMRFEATDKVGRYTQVPTDLRGGDKRPRGLPELATATEPAVNHTLNVNLNAEGQGTSRLNMNIDNLPFDSPDVDIAHQGAVYQWNLINADVTQQTHAVHLHLAMFRVIGRQDFDRARYAHEQDSPGHIGGQRWAPSAEEYLTGPLEDPAPYERGWKDTVRCPRGSDHPGSGPLTHQRRAWVRPRRTVHGARRHYAAGLCLALSHARSRRQRDDATDSRSEPDRARGGGDRARHADARARRPSLTNARGDCLPARPRRPSAGRRRRRPPGASASAQRCRAHRPPD